MLVDSVTNNLQGGCENYQPFNGLTLGWGMTGIGVVA